MTVDTPLAKENQNRNRSRSGTKSVVAQNAIW